MHMFNKKVWQFFMVAGAPSVPVVPTGSVA